MEPAKVDRRVKYTKLMLKDSLIEILESKPIEKITIKEICDRADINRGTFYSHYSDQFDLYDSIVEDFIMKALDILGNFMEPEPHSIYKSATKVYEYVKENYNLAKVLLKGMEVFGFDKYSDKFNEVIHKVYLDEIKKSVGDVRFVDMVYQYVAAANLTLLKYWVNTGMQESPAEMAALALKLTSNGVSAFGIQR